MKIQICLDVSSFFSSRNGTTHRKHRSRPPTRVPHRTRRRISRSSRARSRSITNGSNRYTRSWPERYPSTATTTTSHRPTTLPWPHTPHNWPQHEEWENSPVPREQRSSIQHHHTPQSSPLLQEKGFDEIPTSAEGSSPTRVKSGGRRTRSNSPRSPINMYVGSNFSLRLRQWFHFEKLIKDMAAGGVIHTEFHSFRKMQNMDLSDGGQRIKKSTKCRRKLWDIWDP